MCFIEQVVTVLLEDAEKNGVSRFDDYSIKTLAETNEAYRFLLPVYQGYKEEEKHRITFKKRSAPKIGNTHETPQTAKVETGKSAWDYEEEGFDDI